ncbi:MAG TPA: hypothetical protein VMZ22_02215 [Acidimicrobiales bacterium]|nr:hypothetical protein [Acidimicrobiales bacterium]
MTLRDVHVAWAWVTITSNGLAGLWALGAHYWPALRTRALWWFTTAAQVAMFVQVALGVGIVTGQDVDPPQFHMFYGFVAIITIGLAYSYRQQLQKVYLWYGAFGLFIMGLGIRALLVGTAR